MPYSGNPTPYCPVDHRVKASAILLPKDSPYRKLSDKDLESICPVLLRIWIDWQAWTTITPMIDPSSALFIPKNGIRENLTGNQ